MKKKEGIFNNNKTNKTTTIILKDLFHCFDYLDVELISDVKQSSTTLMSLNWLQGFSISITRSIAAQCSHNVLGAGSKKAILCVCA